MSFAGLPNTMGAILVAMGIGLVCYQLIWAPSPHQHTLTSDAALTR